ncbi:hypothetical protein [Clostridium cochlearium]|uniref:hypothetical protein n=1 Tax=Clostridium cochlearium TaxID=1494 RepID=UPI000B94B432|nr:beta-lactamase domain-containing protein [Clostridium cochlearium]STA92651.1 beta-lactamase domain-containing protein [Clostridium cochlearium]
MYEWFTVEKIDECTFSISEYQHWEHIGGHKSFNNIAVHEKEKEWISNKFPIPR